MRHSHACGSRRHELTRREVLRTALGAAGVSFATVESGFENHLLAAEIRKRKKQVLFVWLDGAMSQFESWDPKPGTRFGGPFRSIATSVPGVQLSELMPEMSRRMHRFSVVRSMHTRFEDHSRAVVPIQQGDPKNRGVTYPFLGSALAKLLDDDGGGLPPYIHIKPGSGGFMFQDAGFLGPKYGALALGDGKPPNNLLAPDTKRTARDQAQRALRERFNGRFAEGRITNEAEAYGYTYHMADQMARHARLFDPSTLKSDDVVRYGGGEFARHMVQARQLLEAGVKFVKVTMFHWDTHGDNFNCHLDGVPQVDRALAAMIDDLVERGMYDDTLVLVLSEFGRTPKINARVGRDHWPECWSLGLGGGGIKPGVVVGKTNELGTFNANDEYDIGHVFHTVFQALGVDSEEAQYDNGGQPLPIAHDDYRPIKELLA